MNDNETNTTTETPQEPKFEPLSCLNPSCHRTVMARGLCRNCYATAAGLIRRGKISWEELEKAGKSLPSQHKLVKHGSVTEWLLPSTK